MRSTSLVTVVVTGEEDPQVGQPQPLGRLLDSLGVEHEPGDGELVLGAVVLLKVMEPDGEITMRAAWSPGLSWMERVGMNHAAAQADVASPGPVTGATRDLLAGGAVAPTESSDDDPA